MKVLLKGYYGYGNLGDDILMFISYQLLKSKYPEAVISVFSNNSINNENANSPKGYNLYIHKILGNKVEIIDWTFKGEFDLVFHGGGGIYFDNTFSRLSQFTNLFISKLSINKITYLDKLARKLTRRPHHIVSKQKVGVGIGIGKYSKGATQLFYDLAEIGTYKKLIVRDDFSSDFLKKKRMPSKNYSRNTDLAFVDSWNKKPYKVRDQVVRIGIVIKDHLPEKLQKILIDFYNKQSSKGYKVTFISFNKAFDSQIEKRCLGFNYLAYDPLNLEEFLEQLYQQDVLITSRAHGVILGACLGIPSVVLNTEVKLKEVGNMFPKGCLQLDDWEYSHLHEKFEYLKTNYRSMTSQLHDEVLHNQKLAEQLSQQF